MKKIEERSQLVVDKVSEKLTALRERMPGHPLQEVPVSKLSVDFMAHEGDPIVMDINLNYAYGGLWDVDPERAAALQEVEKQLAKNTRRMWVGDL